MTVVKVAGADLDIAIRRMSPETFIAANPRIVEARRRVLERESDGTCFQRACPALAKLDFTPVLEQIRNPTLVMPGTLDQTTPPLRGSSRTGFPGRSTSRFPAAATARRSKRRTRS